MVVVLNMLFVEVDILPGLVAVDILPGLVVLHTGLANVHTFLSQLEVRQYWELSPLFQQIPTSVFQTLVYEFDSRFH